MSLSFSTFHELIKSHRDDHRAFLKYYDNSTKVREHSYHQYVHLVQKCATLLQSKLQSFGSRAAVVAMSNSDHQLIVYGALLYLGATIVPANPAETDDYLATLKRNSRSSLIISDVDRLMETLVFRSFDVLDGIEPLSDNLISSGHLDNLAVMVSTSGTTNDPKLVCLTQQNLFANMYSLKEFHQLKRESIHLCVLPLFHVNAFGFSFLTTLLVGGTLILNRRFHKESFWRLIEAECAQTVNVVPEIVQRLIDAYPEKHFSVSPSLKYIVSAASALTKSQFIQFRRLFNVSLIQGYGLSEAVNFSLVTPPELDTSTLDQLLGNGTRPPAGIAIPGNEARILSDKTLEFLPQGQVGEIVVRGKNVMSGYFENPTATSSAFYGEWLRTGDCGYFIELSCGRQFFYVTGRKKNIAKRNSESICLEEIEDHIKKVSGLTDIAVIGFPNKWTGEEIGLVVCSNNNADLSPPLDAQLANAFAHYKRPKIVQWVDEIPKTGSFKIKRRLLVDLFKPWSDVRFTELGPL
jgi:long-chain acyl-CoA synthetase